MAGLVTREALSEGADGIPIPVAGTLISTGTTIHTAHATSKDCLFLKAGNTSSTVTQKLVLQWGGITAAFSVPHIILPEETIVISVGDFLTSNLVLKAYSNTASVVNIVGYVDRYAP
jgi:hypothetical protein